MPQAGGHLRKILHREILQGIRTDPGAYLLQRAAVGSQLAAVWNGGAEITGIQEGRGGHLEVDLPGACLPQQMGLSLMRTAFSRALWSGWIKVRAI